MVIRIVKLHFQAEHLQDFLDFFETIKHRVNSFPGCNGMRLIQDLDNPQIIMTYSDWNSVSDLNKYRKSETFGEVWPKIKPWFEQKAEAWTLHSVFDGFQ